MGDAGTSTAVQERLRKRQTSLISQRGNVFVASDGTSKVAAAFERDDETGRTWDSPSLKICLRRLIS